MPLHAALRLTLLGAHAENVVITDFSEPGRLVFEEIPDAIGYRVEWASGIDGAWTNFIGSVGHGLDAIPASGSGIVTASVPMFYRVVAQVPPSNMVYIPAGTFVMGHATNVFPAWEGEADEIPQHEVFTDAFFIDQHEIPQLKKRQIRVVSYGMDYNYAILTDGPDDHPARGANWYDVVKWCNARSETEGLTPVYYTDSAFTTIYRSGEIDPFVLWSADGYRLPTEAEWERAARGGAAYMRYSWSDSNDFSHDKANRFPLCPKTVNGDSSDHGFPDRRFRRLF